jgi:hypothetical protein
MVSIQSDCPVDATATVVPLGHFRRYVPQLFLILISAAFLYPFMRMLSGTVDEGVFLYGAQLVATGAVPARDFVEPQGPGSFYWLAAFFKIFGTNFVTARGLLLVTGVATVLLVYHLARRIERIGLFSALFVLGTSVPLMVMNSPHYDSNLFGLLAFAVFLRGFDRVQSKSEENRRSSWLFFLAGLLAGLTTCFIQQKGFWLTISFLIALVLLARRKSVRPCAMVLSGYSLIVLVVLLFYAIVKAIPDLVQANFIWPLHSYSTINAAPYGYTLFELLWPQWLSALRTQYPVSLAYGGTLLMSVPFLFIMAVPVLVLLMGWCWRSSAFKPGMLPYWLTGYALWISELQRLDLGHLRNGCIILVILFFAMIEQYGRALLKGTALCIIGCLELSAMPNAASAMALRSPVYSRHGTLYAEQHNEALDFLVAHTRPGENIFVYPYQPIYYFLADLRNATRFSYLQYRLHTDDQLREAVRDLEDKKVRYVLWDRTFGEEGMRSIFPAYRLPPRERLIVEPYLESHYRQINLLNGFRILERLP